jgi:hypothetical protein
LRTVDLGEASKKCIAVNWHKGFKVSRSISLKNAFIAGVKVFNNCEMRMVIICVGAGEDM